MIEERLFERRRDLFTDLSVVFLDTTSLSFEGDGGESLGEYGYSKDLRPDLRQMILGLVMDGAGWPVCTEMWPGNTADVTVLLPIVDRLRQRFAIGRVCVVADRGMISAETIAGLEARGLDYILGAREHTDKLVRQIVLDDQTPFVPLAIERRQGDTQLFVKQVKRAGVRYIVCRNESEAANDRAVREAIVAALDAQLKRGDKALIGNAGYRRYLRKTATAKGQPVFEIDPGKLAEAARFDGIFVLRTNARLTPLQAVLRYRDLVRVEDLFRRAKALLRTRPIFHPADLPLLRRGDPWSRVLLVPGTAAAKAPGRSCADRWCNPRMENAIARSRSPAATAHSPSPGRLACPHRCLADPGRSIPLRQDRPAGACQANRATAGNAAAKTRRKTPRPPEA